MYVCVCGHFNYVNAALRLGESSIIQWAGPESERGAIWSPLPKLCYTICCRKAMLILLTDPFHTTGRLAERLRESHFKERKETCWV